MCMTSARLLLRLFAQLAIDDNDWAAEGAGGARNGSGVEGFSDVAELDRRNEVDPTDWRDDDAVTESSSTTAGVRVLDARALSSAECELMPAAAAACVVASFSLSGDTDVEVLTVSDADAPDEA